MNVFQKAYGETEKKQRKAARTLSIYVTPEEYLYLTEKADNSKFESISSYLRDLVIKGIEKETETKAMEIK